MTSPLANRRDAQPADVAASPWWSPHVHADRRPFLLARNRIVAALRGHFEAEGFLEVEAAALQVSPGNETHLHAFATDLIEPDGGGRRRLYLHTSPEFACKKLLAAGEERIFTFARVFRNRERSGLHHPEFTMLEWYRAREPYERLMTDCSAVLQQAAKATGRNTACWRDRTAELDSEPERLSVVDAFRHYAGVDLLATLPDDAEASPDPEPLAAAARAIGLRVADDDGWSDLFSRILSDRVEVKLGLGRPTILFDYPASEAALARRKLSDRRLAERFELYVCGMEVANGFGELTDPVEQRRRFEADMDEKARIYGERYPLDEDLLAALATMPPASGIALGLDRLVMLATGAESIDKVIWTPVP